MITSLFRKIFPKKMLKTKDGLFQLNTAFKKEFWSGGTFKRVDEFNDDFVEAIKNNRLGVNTEFSFSTSFFSFNILVMHNKYFVYLFYDYIFCVDG